MFSLVLAARDGIHVLLKQFWFLLEVVLLIYMETATAITKTHLTRMQVAFLLQQRERTMAGT
jgi:hypothetical protein